MPPSATRRAAIIQGTTGIRCSGATATGVVPADGSGVEPNEGTVWRESRETAGGGGAAGAFCAGAATGP
jgi:hypothetical protein